MCMKYVPMHEIHATHAWSVCGSGKCRVTAIEVARMEADGEEQRFMQDLRQEVLRQAAERNIKLLSLERNSDPKV